MKFEHVIILILLLITGIWIKNHSRKVDSVSVTSIDPDWSAYVYLLEKKYEYLMQQEDFTNRPGYSNWLVQYKQYGPTPEKRNTNRIPVTVVMGDEQETVEAIRVDLSGTNYLIWFFMDERPHKWSTNNIILNSNYLTK